MPSPTISLSFSSPRESESCTNALPVSGYQREHYPPQQGQQAEKKKYRGRYCCPVAESASQPPGINGSRSHHYRRPGWQPGWSRSIGRFGGVGGQYRLLDGISLPQLGQLISVGITVVVSCYDSHFKSSLLYLVNERLQNRNGIFRLLLVMLLILISRITKNVETGLKTCLTDNNCG